MTRPNIVFIMSDDHAAHAISAYGSRVNSTPHLDRIAAEGTRMDAVFCTNSICSPSRASILTGTYSHVNGVSSIWTEMDYRVPTFIDALHDDGYATAMFGKWHLGEHGRSLPRGFDAWQIFPGQGDYVDPDMIDEDGSKVVPGYATDIVTDLSIDWIDEQAATDAPFAVMVHHKAPHRPWIPDEKHSHLYADGTIPEPETFFDDLESRSQAVRGVHMTIADDMGSEDLKTEVPEHLRGEENREARMRWKYQIYMRDYLQCIQSIDDNVGRLLDHLDEQGLRENTIVVYTSDQGFFLGDHGWFDKRLMLDESLTMPMLLRWPAAIPAGRRIGDVVSNVDFAATLLEAAGEDSSALPAQQGRSFLPQLRGESVPDWRQAVYYRYWEHDDPEHHAPAHYGVRTRELKYIRYYNDGLGSPGSSDRIMPVEDELYDLVADPRELTNVAADPAYAQRLVEMQELTARLQAEYGDAPYEGPDTPRLEWPTAR